MTVEQFIAVLTALTALVAAVGAVFVQIRSLTLHLNSRMDALIELTATSSHDAGVREGEANAASLPQIGPKEHA